MTQQCFNHPKREATGTCRYCGRNLCSECLKGESCKDEIGCLEYQNGEYSDTAFDVETAINDYISDEPALDSCINRLIEVQEELGRLETIFGASSTQMEENVSEQEIERLIVKEVNRMRIPGFCAHKLAEEGIALLNLIAVRMILLRQIYEQSGNSAQVQKLTEMQKSIEEIEPLMHQTLEAMEKYKALDARKIIESITMSLPSSSTGNANASDHISSGAVLDT